MAFGSGSVPNARCGSRPSQRGRDRTSRRSSDFVRTRCDSADRPWPGRCGTRNSAPSLRPNYGENSLGGHCRQLVLPYPDDFPAELTEDAVCVAVTRLIGGEFGLPPLAVRVRPRPMFGASVPEASIHKDGDPGAAERDIDGPTSLTRHRISHSISQSAGMQFPPERNFSCGVSALRSAHPSRDRGRRGTRVIWHVLRDWLCGGHGLKAWATAGSRQRLDLRR